MSAEPPPARRQAHAEPVPPEKDADKDKDKGKDKDKDKDKDEEIGGGDNGAKKAEEKDDEKKTHAPTADPNVQLAFRLGWHIAELYHGELPPPPQAVVEEPPDQLPGISSLTAHARAELVLREIRAELYLLREPAKLTGVALPGTRAVLEELMAPGHESRDVKLQILALHQKLLRDLSAVDFRFGKAYGLGRALAETSLIPSHDNLPAFKNQFDEWRVRTIGDWLDDLTSAFPAHSAPAVRRGLTAWEQWLKPQTPEQLGNVDGLTRLLRDQARLWRSLLSGEKRPEDLLGPGDYVRAGQNLIRRTSRLAWEFVKSGWSVLLIALLIVWIVATIIVSFLDGGSQTAVAIVAILGGLGISWKAIGATLGKMITRVEQPLWRVELAESIAVAATWLPEPAASEDETAGPPLASTKPLAEGVHSQLSDKAPIS